MKKIYIIIPVLLLFFAIGAFKSNSYPKDLGVIILNTEKIPDLSVRTQLKSAILGEVGSFENPFEITLYTDSKSIDQYKYIKSQIENWGGKCTLIRQDEQNIFEFRSLGALPLYIHNGKQDEIYQFFLSDNFSFFSTGNRDKEYDKLLQNEQFALCLNLLSDNVNIIIC